MTDYNNSQIALVDWRQLAPVVMAAFSGFGEIVVFISFAASFALFFL
jgi:hypothetical protein